MKFIKQSSPIYSIDNEVCMQNMVAKLNLGPKVIDSWICKSNPNQGIIVMEKIGQINFAQFINDLSKLNQNTKDDFISTLQIIRVVYEILIKVYTLNKAGIFHHDLNLRNIMIKFNDNNLVESAFMIDFGTTVTKNKLLAKEKFFDLDQTSSIETIGEKISSIYKAINIDKAMIFVLLSTDILNDHYVINTKNMYLIPCINFVIDKFYTEFIFLDMNRFDFTIWDYGSVEDFKEKLNKVSEDLKDFIKDYKNDMKIGRKEVINIINQIFQLD